MASRADVNDNTFTNNEKSDLIIRFINFIDNNKLLFICDMGRIFLLKTTNNNNIDMTSLKCRILYHIIASLNVAF